ncbi:DUF3237 family protein [Larsenimonas suaedae]|uniref:UPF0311 protein QC825_05285 n=1 Tax=Larsenimonas suaedae TaxID=1851019 RepID=A0ABU1GVM2_9GAMM|nr:DUF3237 family protein [Larsenimonas suaedae]MCM2971930.1 DUF3237 family protein [Larsenimonas suaedae]MDR5895482.1 DUF3237 family protein [Larsenimonas suaedae]
MSPTLEFSFRIAITVDAPTIVSSDPARGKRQLIPILGGEVSGALEGHVLPGGVDSQFIQPDGLCRLSARYALATKDGTVYIENNGIRRLPSAFTANLFGDDMGFFKHVPVEDIYFKATPTFEVDDPRLHWLTESVFICDAKRTPDTVNLDMYRVL